MKPIEENIMSSAERVSRSVAKLEYHEELSHEQLHEIIDEVRMQYSDFMREFNDFVTTNDEVQDLIFGKFHIPK